MKRYKLANGDLSIRYTKESKIQINNMTESKIILKNFNKNNKKYYEAALVLFVLMVGILYFSIYFSFKNIIFKYGFDVRIIFKDFFEQYAVFFIIITPFLIYLFYEFFKKNIVKL